MLLIFWLLFFLVYLLIVVLVYFVSICVSYVTVCYLLSAIYVCLCNLSIYVVVGRAVWKTLCLLSSVIYLFTCKCILKQFLSLYYYCLYLSILLSIHLSHSPQCIYPLSSSLTRNLSISDVTSLLIYLSLWWMAFLEVISMFIYVYIFFYLPRSCG